MEPSFETRMPTQLIHPDLQSEASDVISVAKTNSLSQLGMKLSHPACSLVLTKLSRLISIEQILKYLDQYSFTV
jgi:hypothetical protein